ncbi:MAG: hypothetical protein Q8L74_09960 [Nitrospirota bacterium]|nr:hypothetical protein [Nitrospirota bacterium]
MWLLVLLFVLWSAASSFAESGFPGKSERRSNFFNPSTLVAPDNPLNPAEKYPAPANTPNPRYRSDPSNPTNPANRFIPSNPFNPANEYNPQNPLNPADGYRPGRPFSPLDRPSGSDR